ncbi:hypothetical protein COCC4DRAFT_32791 [Bipolaris maydis ATCC 48331]|uniref:Uncharacterized protein n=2 Tax=Cochliobolus heterostrophus TaxID=5016 RepID=M2UG74_COCH5|nr:uncharacterized protein COCC4DRAFT_32791 [Bipolaris maydis ATCC 48331]EMD86922.1 hypothetical protein COCHEDRAFT_1023707 [Bipolaris maydis C5]KAH7559846.1 hypothetical protein BM1_03480 [Bipolaris maydis]ENI04082.1 hypothetical protein COCC4DRAFT_32791 [Bipolaris maydis ATCC 48331]KAJ5020802.1 hypothetical protein J3E73DRAFT_358154 [Bipolaris maydis]KAJ5020915.1 hypothetical protein J3E73DRAFT_357258 [Bipolaris maydis]
MSFFPIIPSTSLYSSILALPPPHDHHHHTIHMDHHTLSSLLSHVLAPTSPAACPTPAPLSASPPHQAERQEKEARIIRLAEEEELARIQSGEQDGTPLCREEGIAAWHQCQHQERKDSMEAQKKRPRRSLEWLAGVIRERKEHA